MVHLHPLPGTPFYEAGSFRATLDRAVRSALALRDGGADGCLVQTVDRAAGVADSADPARVAAMALVVDAVVRATGEGFHVGVQIMRNAVRASLGVAKVVSASSSASSAWSASTFVRVGTLVGRSDTPHGEVVGDPEGVMSYRAVVDAWDVPVVADVHSMHTRWVGEGRSVGDVARAAHHAGADVVAVGDADEDRTLELVADVRRRAPGVPVLLPGYTNHENAARLLAVADGAFVGTCLERDGWGGEIDVDRVKDYVAIARGLDAGA